MAKDHRITYTKRHCYRTKSNKLKTIRTPGKYWSHPNFHCEWMPVSHSLIFYIMERVIFPLLSTINISFLMIWELIDMLLIFMFTDMSLLRSPSTFWLVSIYSLIFKTCSSESWLTLVVSEILSCLQIFYLESLL